MRRPRLRPASPDIDRRHARGRRGERLAARHLRRRGLRVLARNLRTPVGEVDILALDPSCDDPRLVVVEVKTGWRADPDTLEARIDRDQRRRLRAAVRWVEDHAVAAPRFGTPGPMRARCDWMLVRLDAPRPTITHVRDVFG